MEDLLERAFYAHPRFALIVLLMLSGTGLALVALGVYGVMAYSVSQQTRDIAIRMALGGEQGHVVRMVLQSGLRLLAVGIVTGLVASVATNRLLAGQLWNTSSYDPATLVAVVAVVIFIGACACWIPAHRATRVDPIVSLRHE
jgi:putative ABC transport system permease protein